MSFDQPLAIEPALLAAVLVVVVGFTALWSNPTRPINCIFFTISLHVAAWLGCLYFALTAFSGLYWLRICCAIGGALPVHFWFLREAVTGGGSLSQRVALRSVPWLGVSAFMCVLPMTSWFVPLHSTSENKIYGLGYWLYILMNVLVYIEMSRDTFAKIKLQSGVARIELQILLVGGSAAATTIILLMAIGVIFQTSLSIHIQPLVVLLFYALTVTAITTHRIFDARYLLQLLLQRFALVLVVAGAAYGVDIVFQLFLPEPLAFFITTGVMLASAAELNSWIDRYSGRYPKAVQARAAIINASRDSDQFPELIGRFETILCGWAQTERVVISVRDEDRWIDGRLTCGMNDSTYCALKEAKWSTPERLSRERKNPRTILLSDILEHERMGVFVFTKGATLEIVVRVGIRSSRRPFTFPEVTQLQELSSIIVGALATSHLSAKAQQAERLAAVGLLGAGVAHEIRNPLVTIKTFVQLLPTHYADASFRNKFLDLIASEVGRIERLTEQLLDLASPRKYHLEETSMHDVIRACLTLISSKAEEECTTITTQLCASRDRLLLDPNAVKQVLLNLCFNAIQAQETQIREKWVSIKTQNLSETLELTVSDNGPGIAPEMRFRLFEAFQTTKSSGFGLGLAISGEILTELGASIKVDPYADGKGATFRVLFPCRPLS